ncbi:hypothetical protein HMPREF1040_1033 [Megasphaera sp. UPII 135-E]|nr:MULTISPECIES: hypothetical protein [Megasphaera]EGS33893.1 hypothetical protein HMPREF1040_1033 [Megasphaera sp. UPII 135-E]
MPNLILYTDDIKFGYSRKMVILVLLEELRKPIEDLKQRIQEIGDSL